MKKTIFIFIIFFSSFAFAQAQESDIVKEMQDSIQQLNLLITNLQKIIESQEKEVVRLKKLCSDAGIDITPLGQMQVASDTTTAEIEKPIFGIYLGETLKALSTRFKVSKSKYIFADKSCPGQIWSVKNKSSDVRNLLVCTYNDQIYEIDIEFKDASKANCLAIKEQLRKDYQIVYQDRYEELLGRSTFKTVINGVEMGIELNYYPETRKKARLTLTYVHTPLFKKVLGELEKQKAAGLSAAGSNPRK